MKLFNCFAQSGYHTSIITTFALDFGAYESIVLPRLREAGCNNNVLIADARMLAHAMGDSFSMPKFAGRRYSVVGAAASGVFHPKIILQLGKTAGRLLVASANMTAPGLAGNLEVVGEVTTDENDRQSLPLFRAAIDYLTQFVAVTPVARRQIDWALKRTHWLNDDAAQGEPLVELADGGRLAFLARNDQKGLGELFVELVGRRTVTRLIAISPYWDPGLAALRELRKGLAAQKTAVVIQQQSALFPAGALRRREGISVFDVDEVKGTHPSRFAHAKVLVAETNDGDCVLYGSANCTTAALGAKGVPGDNEEACLYRELASGEALKALGLETAFFSAIDLVDLPPYAPADNIPLDDLERKLPGRFELCDDLLRWSPPAGTNVINAELEFFDQVGEMVVCSLNQIGTEKETLTFRFISQELPHFARFRSNGVESSLGIIVVEQAIQDAQRRAKTKAVENALALLEDEDAYEGLWMLELIQKIEAAESGSRDAVGQGRRQRRRENDDHEHRGSQVLTYEQFIAGRKAARMQSMRAASHLTASHHESVRRFLNALIGSHNGKPVVDDDDTEAARPKFSLGDETADGENAIEQDERFNLDEQQANAADELRKQKLRRQRQFVKDTQRTIVEGVERFLETLRDEVQYRPLGVVDLLRLRVMLMVILGAGSKHSSLLPFESNAEFSRRQVLPSKGEASWRRLVGRLLFEFFRNHGGKNVPLIKTIVLEVDGDLGLPDDVLECWATCYWAVCASRIAVDEQNAPFKLSDAELRIAHDVYASTRLRRDELLSESVKAVFNGASERYAAHLGISAPDVVKEHQRILLTLHDPAVMTS
jgi:hypothetical protein